MENIILPAVVLGIRPLAVVIQLMRNSLLETFGQDYIPARAKGLSEFQIIRKHALKLLNPVVTAISGVLLPCLQVLLLNIFLAGMD
jgi:peptide/nickel transport system permease protein